MSDRYKVSVIIPCYNHGHYLKNALDSVEKSTYPNIEVIVVDDGSTDENTIKHIESLNGYMIKGRAVKFLRQQNQGLSATRNNAIKESSGEFILPLDADDMIDSTYIEKCVWVLTKYPDVSIVYPSVQHFGARNDVWHARPYDLVALLNDNFMIASSMFRRKVWEDVSGYDVKLPGYEDWDFWIRAGAKGHTGYWLREPLFFYRKADVSMLVSVNKKRRKLIRVIRKKNAQIFKTIKRGRESKNLKRTIKMKLNSHKISQLKWRLFVFYVRLASVVPVTIKDKARGLIKPLIQKMFKYNETGLVQEQTLDSNYIDEFIEKNYLYNANSDYSHVLSEGILYTLKNDSKISILFITPWLEVGGADKVNLDLISEFKFYGHDIHVFSTLSSDHRWHKRFKDIVPNITHLGNWFTELDELLDYVIDYILTKKIDIIQMSNSQLGYQIAEVIKKYCPHVKIIDLLHMEEPYYPFDYFRYSVRYKEVFDHRVVITPYLKEAMIRKYGETAKRVSIIPNGISIENNSYSETLYTEKLWKNLNIVGFVGRMEEQKQPLVFLEAALKILQEMDNVNFLMIGEGSLLQSAQRYVKRNPLLQEKVVFLGRRDDVVSIMKQKFKVLMAPSLREGLPIVGLEAMSMGLPIVASDVPGWSDIVSQGCTGFLCTKGNSEEMAERVLQLLKDPNLCEEMSRNAYMEVTTKFNLKNTANQYLKIYNHLTTNYLLRPSDD